MGKPTGFLEYDRQENIDRAPLERLSDYGEFHLPLDTAERRKQGARCMNCGVPLCQSAMRLHGMVTGCPLHNLIPEWNDQVYAGHERHALSRLLKTSNFPEFTGRVCPALCEKACINGMDGDPVTVHDNELYIIETAFANGWMQPRIPALRSGKKVAVVGSGPSGLAAADQLNHRGHLVTVFEREDRIGGLLMYGIPNMKLDKTVIGRRHSLMEAEGVTFRTGVNVDAEMAGKLLAEYDAVILACGAKQARRLSAKITELDENKPEETEGTSDKAEKTGKTASGTAVEDVRGVFFAVDFLTGCTKSLLSGTPDLRAAGKHVVIIGGGDTGNDCIGTVLRQGCRSVTAIEMMPAPPVERAPSNPWPDWPKVLKTDYGHAEAIARFGKDPRVFSTTVNEIYTKKGKIRKLRTVQVRFAGGRLEEIPGTEKTLPCDLLLIAAGFTGCEPYTAGAFGVSLSQRGTVSTPGGPESYRTNVEKVFTAGDMHRGQSLVVWNIVEGRGCAREVDEYLMGYTML
ncbi:MAG: glutamate synthase subunit beta [Eubacteriales bacterium]|nr:glutamate synthase subunit beta [Eubacteriales bacterium]